MSASAASMVTWQAVLRRIHDPFRHPPLLWQGRDQERPGSSRSDLGIAALSRVMVVPWAGRRFQILS